MPLSTCLLGATAVLLMALYPLLPESPHYLAVNGRLLEAQDVLHRISHWNGRPLPPGQLVADKSRKASAGVHTPSRHPGMHGLCGSCSGLTSTLDLSEAAVLCRGRSKSGR